MIPALHLYHLITLLQRPLLYDHDDLVVDFADLVVNDEHYQQDLLIGASQ